MGKIENDHQLQVSREAVEGLRRAFEGYKAIPQPDIRKMCMDSLRIWIDRIEREIEEYLAQKATETSLKKTPIEAVSG